jgi:hypothetical protein
MCQQCITEAVEYGEIVPGFYLYKSKVGSSKWPAGEYAIVQYNDPTFYLKGIGVPLLDPCFGKRDDEVDALLGDPAVLDSWNKFCTQAELMAENLLSRPNTGFALIDAAIKAGYVPEEGLIEFWLLHKIACLVEKKK